MFFEAVLLAAVLLGGSLWWASYIRPENVLARMEQRLDIPVAPRTMDFASRRTKAWFVLRDRYATLCWRIAGMVRRLVPPGPEQDRLLREAERLVAHTKPSSGILDEAWRLVFFDLQCGSLAADETCEFCDLDDAVEELVEELRILEKLERVAP